MSRPAAPTSDTPHVWKAPFRWDEYDGVCRDAENWMVSPCTLLELLNTAHRDKALAQTEIKGHMRVEDELQARIAELEKDAARLRALMDGLEVQEIDTALGLNPATLRVLGMRIARAAKLGAHLVPSDEALKSRA